jgi:hypothetical protein
VAQVTRLTAREKKLRDELVEKYDATPERAQEFVIAARYGVTSFVPNNDLSPEERAGEEAWLASLLNEEEAPKEARKAAA